ncbi:tyrosine-type recombinase/integrase [Ammoniphilus sp. 3BR4]|uniref:tyrosine-type recombinase/integrase n=1 Tax=Ammoniphilus sp. 3BR4 TaxID=3158265 RepID=UPI003464F49B
MLLKFAVKDFLDDREFKNVSPQTIANYRNTLNDFHNYCVEKEIVDTSDITASIIKSYLMYCQRKRNNNPTTINTKIRNLKVFFNYLENELQLFDSKNNPIGKIVTVKSDVQIEVFTDSHIKQMLNYYRRLKYRDKSFYAYRDTAIIITLLGTGIRLGELINLKWNHVDLNNLTITLFGKKREQSSIPMTIKLKKELAEYKLFLEQSFEDSPAYLFTDKDGQPLTANAIKNIFKRLKTIMSFKDVRLSAHTFRHTFAHRCLMAGMDIFTLQKLLRHNDLSMTQKYVAIWGTALKEQNDKYNPLNNIEV